MKSLINVPRFLGRCAVSALVVLPLACGGSSQPANTPDDTALLAQPDDGTAAPSSAAVQQGIDALKAGDFEKAKQILGDAHQKDPQDPQAAFYYAVALDNSGDVEGAIAGYREALSLEPNLLEARQNLSAVLVEKQDFKGALEVVDGGLKQSPDDPGLLANRAVALDSTGSPDAVGAYAKALEKAPDNGPLRFNYATALAKAGKKDESLAELKKIPTDDPDFAAAVANVYKQLGAFDDCIRLLDGAVAKKPNAELLVRRGSCKGSKKDGAGATADFKAALELDPNFAPAHYYYGRELVSQGKLAEGRAEVEKAAQLGAGTPVEAAAKDTLSQIDKQKASGKAGAKKK